MASGGLWRIDWLPLFVNEFTTIQDVETRPEKGEQDMTPSTGNVLMEALFLVTFIVGFVWPSSRHRKPQ